MLGPTLDERHCCRNKKARLSLRCRCSGARKALPHLQRRGQPALQLQIRGPRPLDRRHVAVGRGGRLTRPPRRTSQTAGALYRENLSISIF